MTWKKDGHKKLNRWELIILLIAFGVAVYYAMTITSALMSNRDYEIFNASFFSILIFIILFTSLQFVQNKEGAYLYYTIYLVASLVYFTKALPSGFPIPLSDDIASAIEGFKENYGAESELTLSMLFVIAYCLFFQSFFDVKHRFPQLNRIFNYGYLLFVLYIIIDLILIIQYKKSIWYELAAKFSLAFPAFYVMYTIYKAKVRLFNYILFGSAALILGASITGLIIVFARLGYNDGYRIFSAEGFPNQHYIFLQVGVMFEILFFSTALGRKSLINQEESQQEISEKEKENNQLRIKQLESDLKALRSQMNPHFVSNSLNSIKALIQENQDNKAIFYLIRFSQLIRALTELSNESAISLDKELELCKAYIDVESLRFRDTFSYEIHVDKEADLSFYDIPSFIIQPYLENAIWHGLLHKEGKKHLLLQVKCLEDGLMCIIDDNGIGRKRASELKKNTLLKTKSIGTENTKERMKIYEKLNDVEITVEVTDKEDKHGRATGTRVDIFIAT